MNLLKKFFGRFFTKRPPVSVERPETIYIGPVSISKFDLLRNKLALEYSKPLLNPDLKLDEEKVAELTQELEDFERSGKSRWA
ncbi:hypothetical protein KGQ31_02330 [Patescibacteria group bacterium]|nr:hypothetical protein [Patescibacteria group bacterium]